MTPRYIERVPTLPDGQGGETGVVHDEVEALNHLAVPNQLKCLTITFHYYLRS